MCFLLLTEDCFMRWLRVLQMRCTSVLVKRAAMNVMSFRVEIHVLFVMSAGVMLLLGKVR